ncbi:SusC/RagA family TonB-linked outer membrane protein [Flavobacterium rhizosphaerae]|uniref:SusC/RagA family TonB-linked outer membrane protein n=1 Tax=Flavobacterium rhizosphaerae TaxID=3163298 RepID=A0ABW8YS17_9FLAO
MKLKFTWIFTLLLAFFIQFSYAQEKTVTGTVKDDQGLPLPGVIVKVQGASSQGVVTDFDGKFSIQAAQGQKLVFSYVGYQDAVVTVGASSTVPDVELQPGRMLDDVVVEAYRTTSKRKSTVAVTTITSETIENRPNVSFIQSLQGQIPGLNISTGSGSPGSSQTSVLLRGLGSINGNTDPLYVIDGVPSDFANFRTINSNDIASVSVLKDAGATSIYGNRGANGVIVVKTKRGSYDGKFSVRYSGVTGFTTLQDNNYNIMNGQDLLRLERERGLGEGATGGVGGTPLTDAEIAQYPNTNWKDYFFRTGVTQQHNLSFTGGSKLLNSFVSLGYFKQEGIVPSTDIQRISLRSNFTGKSNNERFDYTVNVYGGFSRRNQLEAETRSQTDPDFAGNILQNPLQGMLSSLPYLDPNAYPADNGQDLYDLIGNPSFRNTPYMLMDYIDHMYNRYDEIKLLFNGTANYKITEDLTFGVIGGVDFTDYNRVFARTPESYLAVVAAAPAGWREFAGLEQITDYRNFGFNGNTRLSYSKIFGEKHGLDISVMTEYYKAHNSYNIFQTSGLNPKTYEPGAGTGYVPFDPSNPNLFQRTVSAYKAEAGLFSYFATLDYDYNSRFGLGASIRRDASYRFVADNRWGTFWSVSGRWNIDQEPFMANSSITELKLRGSIGTTGNQNIDGDSPYAAGNYTRTLYGTGSGYNNQSGLAQIQLGNPGLKWETIMQANIGIDFVWNRKVSGTIDVYRKYTKDLFQSAPVSAVYGTYGAFGNTGNLENKGVEALLNYDVFPSSSDFTLRLTANGSYNHNKVDNFPDGATYLTSQAHVNGQVAYQYWLYKYAGVNPVDGNLLFYTADGDLTENPQQGDRVLTGKSPIPRYQGGFGFEANYKGFYLTTQFTFVADVYRFDYDLSNLMDPNNLGSFPVADDFNNAWTPDNRSTSVPSIFATNAASASGSDRFLRDSSYLRLKFTSIGYNVPAKFLDKTFLTSARLYVQGENFLTWTKWRGFDPESNNAGSTFGGYPTPRVFSFGVDLSL